MKLVDWFSEHYATLQQATTAEEAFANPLARLTVAGILAGLLLMASLASSAAEEKKRKVAASECHSSAPLLPACMWEGGWGPAGSALGHRQAPGRPRPAAGRRRRLPWATLLE